MSVTSNLFLVPLLLWFSALTILTFKIIKNGGIYSFVIFLSDNSLDHLAKRTFHSRHPFSTIQLKIWAGSWENVSYVICEQQRRRSAYTSAQSDQRRCFRCLDSITSLDSIAEISRLLLASVAAQAGLCLAWSETPEDTFSHGEAHIDCDCNLNCIQVKVGMSLIKNRRTTSVSVSDVTKGKYKLLFVLNWKLIAEAILPYITVTRALSMTCWNIGITQVSVFNFIHLTFVFIVLRQTCAFHCLGYISDAVRNVPVLYYWRRLTVRLIFKKRFSSLYKNKSKSFCFVCSSCRI